MKAKGATVLMKAKASQVLIGVFFISALLWTILWQKTSTHYYGDTLIAEWFFYAGQVFSKQGLLYNYGLSVYSLTSPPYTHIPPGPEWLQMVFAKMQHLFFKETPYFLVHSVLTGAASLALLACVNIACLKLGRAWLQESKATSHDETQPVISLLTFGTASVQIFSPNPFSLGTLFAVAAAFGAFLLHLRLEKSKKIWLSAYFLVFLDAFWMGLVTFPMIVLSALACALAFSKHLKRDLSLIVFIAVLAGALGFFLKLYQNYLYFGTWQLVVADASSKVAERFEGNAESAYHFGVHLKKLVMRFGFLFGALALYCAVMFYRTWKCVTVRQRWSLLFLVLGMFSWQALMRQHSLNHIYILCSALPILMLLAHICTVAPVKSPGLRKQESVVWTVFAFLQWILLWGFALIPAVR